MARLKLTVGIHAGGMNGVDNYAEQVALAAASAGHEVTLLASTRSTAQALEGRLQNVTVVDLGLPEPSPSRLLAERFWPGLSARRFGSALRAFLSRSDARERTFHFNRPPLALEVRGHARRVCVAAWFYPHHPLGRLRETWRHARGPLGRRAAISSKAWGFYRRDEIGFRSSDVVVAPTERLGRQLESQGHRVAICAPPARVLGEPPRSAAAPKTREGLRFLVCSGDLAHPRKNLSQAVTALAEVARRRGQVTLAAIGHNPELLQRAAVASGDRIHIESLGPLPPERVHQEMRRSDGLLFPSLYEEWGYVAVESLLCGTPVVTLPVYPFAEMLGGNLGAIADDLGTPSLARAIERSLLLPRGPPLAAKALERFGTTAIGEKLTPIWSG